MLQEITPNLIYLESNEDILLVPRGDVSIWHLLFVSRDRSNTPSFEIGEWQEYDEL